MGPGGSDEKEVLKVFNTLLNNNPEFPPQDEFKFGTEEIFVTLAVLTVSYIILATPCFIRSNKQQREQLRGSGSSSRNNRIDVWSRAFKRLLLEVRSFDELRDWWTQSKNELRSIQQQRQFHSTSWEKFMQTAETSRLHDAAVDDGQQTVRTRGDGGVDVHPPYAPLSTIFKSTSATTIPIHVSASEGQFNHVDSKPSDLIDQFYSFAHQNGITEPSAADYFYEESDFRPETDHDRFAKAWESHIRFSQYRRLVLPPTCKLFRPSPLAYHTLFDRREIERNLHLLVDESTWRRIISYLRNLYDLFDKILSRLLNKKSTANFSAWMMNMFRYRIRKQRGLLVEEEEDEEDDDGSVVTTGSGSTVGRKSAMRESSIQSEMTPVAMNRKHIYDPPELILNEEDTIFANDYKSQRDKGHQVTFSSPMNEFSNDERTYEQPPFVATFESFRKLFPPPVQISDHSNNGGSDGADKEVSERLQVKEILDDVVKEIEDNEGLGNSSFEDGKPSSPQQRFLSSSLMDVTDDSSFASTSEQNIEMPASLDTTPKDDGSTLLVKSFANVKKKDTLESHLIPTSDSGSDKISPIASPKKRNNSFDDAANMIFFDTANSNRQLADMSRDVPIPDAGGYILGDEFVGSSCTPLLVFINSRSGSQQGDLLITQFRRLLNPIQIWDLASGGPEKVLKSFSVLTRFQVLICGGDGTVSWIISALEKLDLKRWPPIGILPLGTGNDLARIHGWGGGYNNESLLYILKQVSEAYISMLDLWELDITTVNKKGKTRKEVKSFINYLGVGVDAQAALQVHNLRESKPTLFFSRFFNKAYYALAGGEEAIKNSCTNISEQITLIADGIEIPLPPDSQGIIFLNIDSYTGGVPMWSNGQKPRRKKARTNVEGNFRNGDSKSFPRNDSMDDLADYEASKELSFEEKVAKLTSCDKPSSCQDGYLDVVSIRGAFHLGQIRVGLSNADLLCQCREATVTLKKRVAVQIDGEPWRQAQSTLRIIRKKDRATMLHRSVDANGGVEAEVTKLLNWANEKEIIDRNQYAEIMGEFSRRAEIKKVKQKDSTW